MNADFERLLDECIDSGAALLETVEEKPLTESLANRQGQPYSEEEMQEEQAVD